MSALSVSSVSLTTAVTSANSTPLPVSTLTLSLVLTPSVINVAALSTSELAKILVVAPSDTSPPPEVNVGVLAPASQAPLNIRPAGKAPTTFLTKAVVATVVSSVAFGFVTPVVTVFIVPFKSPIKVVAVETPVVFEVVLQISSHLFDVLPKVAATVPPVSTVGIKFF